MSDFDKPEHLKEQIRIKNAALKKLESEVGKQDEKTQHLVAITQKRIKELQTKIEDQTAEIQYHQNLATELLKRKQPQTDSEEHQNQERERDNQKFRYEKALHLLQNLKNQNEQLSLKLDHENRERERLIKEKGLLARGIQRLRNKPDSPVDENLKRKVADLETQMQEAQQRFDSLIQEKDRLIHTYEEILNQVSDSEEISPTAYKQVRQELETLKQQKKKLENTLTRERRMFQARLSRDIRFLEEEIQQRLKKKLLARKNNSQDHRELGDESFGEGWIMTYADMVTLLLTFFVLYYSIAKVNVDKIMNTAIGQYPGGAGLMSMLDQTENQMTLEALAGLQPDNLKEELENFAQKNQPHHGIEISGQKNRILVQVPGEALFPSGNADLNLENSKAILEKIVEIAKKHPMHQIRILGHTDDTPIATERFPTNWELSSARAASVLRFFLDKNIPAQRLTAAGYGDTFPIARNDTETGRKKNRRVEIVLEKEG